MVVTLGQQYNVGEKPTVMLYTYSLVYCTISSISMQGYRTNTKYTGGLGYNSVFYITSRIGWVSLKGMFRYRCRRNPGNMYITFCYMSLTKAEPPPSNLAVYSTIQCSCCCCCCCCLHIKSRSDLYSVLSNIRTGSTDADAFRGHRLTTQKGYAL